MNIEKRLFANVVKEGVEIRRDLHQHPEGGFKEFRTSKIVAEFLKSCGIETVTGVATTGVIGTLAGNGRSKKVIGLRADMDALAMQEKTNLPYTSVNAGYTHACGHDANTATLLATAKYLAGVRKTIPGTVKFFFQPAEEGLLGAKYMVEHVSWKTHKPHCMVAMHYSWLYKTGSVRIIPGPTMAAGASFKVTITGKGGHGANPHMTRDPVNAACLCIAAINSIKARENDAQNPVTISVTMVHAGSAFNIVPQSAVFEGTIRALDDASIVRFGERIKQIAAATAQAHRCRARTTVTFLFPAVVNDATVTAFVTAALAKLLGKERVFTNEKPFMGSDDFSFFGRLVPATYFNVGCAPTLVGQHNPAYNFNDAALPVGVKAWISLVNAYFAQKIK